jgi:glutamate N-acetyltransferase/amino-acid N-acetyltransferase
MRAVIINSGNANACTGETGLAASRKSCEIAAAALGIAPEEVGVASTGRIGVQMDMSLIERGVALAVPALSVDGGKSAAEAIITTDTVPKAAAVKVNINGKTVTIGAMTKGAGMIDPKLTVPHATMICIITTDAKIANGDLLKMLDRNAQNSFNRITIDGDMSTNDTVLVLANGKSQVEILPGTEEEELFAEALLAVMQNLARRMVLDGEGATKFVTVKIENARSEADGKVLAEAVANSLLCKTAWFGGDPNWGRVVAALGYSGAEFDPDKTDIWYDDQPVVRQGGDAGTPESSLLGIMKQREFTIRINMNEGNAEYWVWTCDVSYEYVKINADYHT